MGIGFAFAIMLEGLAEGWVVGGWVVAAIKCATVEGSVTIDRSVGPPVIEPR